MLTLDSTNQGFFHESWNPIHLNIHTQNHRNFYMLGLLYTMWFRLMYEIDMVITFIEIPSRARLHRKTLIFQCLLNRISTLWPNLITDAMPLRVQKLKGIEVRCWNQRLKITQECKTLVGAKTFQKIQCCQVNGLEWEQQKEKKVRKGDRPRGVQTPYYTKRS